MFAFGHNGNWARCNKTVCDFDVVDIHFYVIRIAIGIVCSIIPYYRDGAIYVMSANCEIVTEVVNDIHSAAVIFGRRMVGDLTVAFGIEGSIL